MFATELRRKVRELEDALKWEQKKRQELQTDHSVLAYRFDLLCTHLQVEVKLVPGRYEVAARKP